MRYVIALIRMLFASPAWADTRCSANSLGATCKDSDGRFIKSRTNSIGTTTYTDNKGKTIKARTNYLVATILVAVVQEEQQRQIRSELLLIKIINILS